VHAIEYGYRLPATPFRPMVATTTVTPLGPAEPVGDLLALHEAAGIQLRLVPNLRAFMDAVAATSVEFSGIRMRNAAPRG